MEKIKCSSEARGAGCGLQQPKYGPAAAAMPAPAVSLLAGVLFEGDAQHTGHLGQNLQEAGT